ncbi:MAG: S1-like domain-containing RNA-binding protein [Bacteroidota bacterium]
MINIGEYNELEVVKQLEFGIYLRADDIEILMPTKWIPVGTRIGDLLNVFIFRDSDDRLIATTAAPLATANTFAFLEVKQTNSIGAFLDWGMDKDLMVPFREQQIKMDPGSSYVVYVYVDEKTNRLAASTRLNKFIEGNDLTIREGDKVDLLIFSETPLGFNAIINNHFSGLIYKNEIFETIRIGDNVKGFVNRIREDNKIDLRLQKSGFELVDEVKWNILKMMKEGDGLLSLGDNSTPEEIKAKLHISKKAFKKAIGALYRERLIKLTEKGIELTKDTK